MELYLKRKADIFLKEWKEKPDKKPLIIKGARQVGKTASILNFAKESYENLVFIDFVRDPKYKVILADGYNPNNIIKNISRIDPSKKFIPNKTLIFFDEITEFPDIATSLKYFNIDKRFDVICSGSLLGTCYKEIESNSVGYKTDYVMHSLDFEEFLWACGYESQNITEEIFTHMVNLKTFNAVQMDIYSSLFLDFSILGGMPAVVSQYIKKGTFEGSIEVQKQIIKDYKEDIRKYAVGLEKAKIISVFNSIVPQLSKENKKFQMSVIKKGARYKDYVGCVEWLQDAGIVNVCYGLNFPELPLRGNFDYKKFKVYLSDTGLLISLLDKEVQDNLRVNKNLGVYKGAIYENMVADALVKSGNGLYYYKRTDSRLEQDFFLRNKDSLIPIEVKSNKGAAKSLNELINSKKYKDISFGVKLSANNIGYSNRIFTYPYFCTFLIDKLVNEFDFFKHIG